MPNLFDQAVTENEDNLDSVNDEVLDDDDFEPDAPEMDSVEDDDEFVAEPEPEADDRDEELDDLLGEWEPGHPRGEEADEEPAPKKKVGKEAPNKQKKDRFEFWQSRATKLQQELEKVKPWDPVIRYLEQNPQALQAVINGKPMEPTQQQSAPELKKPEKPGKPSGFSRIEALQDPESASAKYVEAYEDYKEQLDEYHTKREELREQELENLRKKEQQNSETQNSQRELYNTLVQGYNYTPAKAKVFMETMSDPSVFSMDNLVQFFDIVAGGNQTQVRNVKQQLMKERTEKAKKFPLPANRSGSVDNDLGLSEEDAFNLSMFQEVDRRGQTRRSLLKRK